MPALLPHAGHAQLCLGPFTSSRTDPDPLLRRYVKPTPMHWKMLLPCAKQAASRHHGSMARPQTGIATGNELAVSIASRENVQVLPDLSQVEIGHPVAYQRAPSSVGRGMAHDTLVGSASADFVPNPVRFRWRPLNPSPPPGTTAGDLAYPPSPNLGRLPCRRRPTRRPASSALARHIIGKKGAREKQPKPSLAKQNCRVIRRSRAGALSKKQIFPSQNVTTFPPRDTAHQEL